MMQLCYTTHVVETYIEVLSQVYCGSFLFSDVLTVHSIIS